MRLRALSFVPLLLMLMSITAAAAPISGNIQAYMVIAPDACDLRIAEHVLTGCITEQPMRRSEANLTLQLTVDGLEIDSTTVSTFRGLEFQMITLTSTIGVLSAKDISIFAPSITEIELVRAQDTLTLQYCISRSAPYNVDIYRIFQPCPNPDSRLYRLIEDVGSYHPIVANLIIGGFYSALGMDDEAVGFRKKIVDLRLNFAGFTLGSRMLFANFGTARASWWQTGMIASIEGQTVNGILMRAESWIGSRQGLECFGTCTAYERIYSGIVVPIFTIQEEILFVRNLVFSGITFNIRAEFQLYSEPNSSCSNPGFCYLEINSRARLEPLDLTLNNTLRMGSDLNPYFDYLQTAFEVGDVSVTALWHFYLNNSSNWEIRFTEFISTFSLSSSLTLTSDIKRCTITYVLCSYNSIRHQVYLSGALGNFQLDIQIAFSGLINLYKNLWVDLSWEVFGIEFTSSAIFGTYYLQAFALRVEVGF